MLLSAEMIHFSERLTRCLYENRAFYSNVLQVKEPKSLSRALQALSAQQHTRRNAKNALQPAHLDFILDILLYALER